jgi:hypothetical protein
MPHTYLNGAPLTPPHQLKIMETVTITTNGATIQLNGSYAEIAQFLLNISGAAQQSAPVVANEPEELAPFNAFLQTQLVAYFGDEDAAHIVTALKRSCAIGDYRYLIPTYRVAGEDLFKRQLLKLVSAVHRYKFGYNKSDQKYSLRSEIKYAKACPHCGKLANALYDRLVQENLI